MKYFLCVVGGVMIIEGLPYFAFPGKMKIWIQKILELSPEALQKVGFGSVMIGFIFIYLGIR